MTPVARNCADTEPLWWRLDLLALRDGAMNNDADLNEHDHEAWEASALDALARVQQRQALTIETHGLAGDCQYRWDMDEAAISFSQSGREFLRGRLTMVGSVNHDRQTFLWSWANDALPQSVLGGIERVRQYGETHRYPLLIWPGFHADHKPVRQAHTMAADVLDADLLWRDRDDEMEFLFVVHDLQHIAEAVDTGQQERPRRTRRWWQGGQT